MNKDKLEYYLRLVFLIIGAMLLAYIAVTKLLVLALPFLISWGIAFSVRPTAHKLSRRLKVSPRWVSLVLTLAVLVGGVALLVAILAYAAGEAWGALSGLANSDALYDVIAAVMDPLSGIFGEREGAAELEAKISEAVRGFLTSLLSELVGAVGSFVSFVPSVVVFLVVTLISSVYFALDIERVNERVRALLPERIFSAFVRFKDSFLTAALRYLRSYLTIMLVVFSLMLTGLLLLRVKYALLLALVFAVFDMLPLIGVGTFIVPWSIFEFIVGNTGVGIGLLVLFVVTELVRNLIEPKIVGKNLGVHPIVTLVLLYVSYSLFGFGGILLIPLLSVFLTAFFNKNDPSEIK